MSYKQFVIVRWVDSDCDSTVEQIVFAFVVMVSDCASDLATANLANSQILAESWLWP